MKTYTLTLPDYTTEANNIKETFISKMVQIGELTTEQAKALNQYSIIITEKGILGKLWDKLWEKDETKIIIVKVMAK
jgi:polyhydroxyalkanoate synthesis regulator phasin